MPKPSGLVLTSREIEHIRIKQRTYRRVLMRFIPYNHHVAFHVKYSTYGEQPLYGQIYDKNFLLSSRVKFYPKDRKMVYVIPYFEDQLTRRINRNVKAEIYFNSKGWHKISKYIMEIV